MCSRSLIRLSHVFFWTISVGRVSSVKINMTEVTREQMQRGSYPARICRVWFTEIPVGTDSCRTVMCMQPRYGCSGNCWVNVQFSLKDPVIAYINEFLLARYFGFFIVYAFLITLIDMRRFHETYLKCCFLKLFSLHRLCPITITGDLPTPFKSHLQTGWGGDAQNFSATETFQTALSKFIT